MGGAAAVLEVVGLRQMDLHYQSQVFGSFEDWGTVASFAGLLAASVAFLVATVLAVVTAVQVAFQFPFLFVFAPRLEGLQ